MNWRTLGDQLRVAVRGSLPQIIALGFGIIAASVLMLVAGFNPVNVFSTLFQGALGTTYGQSSIITYTGTYILVALAFIIPGKAGIWNVGGQGQVFLGGISAALVTVFLPLPPVIWPLVAVFVACAIGALWGLIPGVLEAYRNASSIVTTIMLNFVAQAFASFILFYWIGPVVPSARLYTNFSINRLATIPRIPYFTTSIMTFIALLVAVGSAYFLSRTTVGYKIRATGLGSQPAEAKGINTRRMKVLAMVIGGAIAGLAGAGDVLGPGHACGLVACYQDNFAVGYFGGEGFAGITVALVAASNPIGAIFSALFFGILVSGTAAVGASGPQVYLVYAMQGLIILFMAAPYLSRRILSLRRGREWT